MAKPGRKQTPKDLKVIDGGFRADRPGDGEVFDDDVDLDPPKKFRGKAKALIWDKWIRHTPWLTEYDVPTAFAWVELYYEFQSKPTDMIASRIAQMRALNSELGLSYLIASKAVKKKKDVADEHFE